MDAAGSPADAEQADVSGPYIQPLIGETAAFSQPAVVESLVHRGGFASASTHHAQHLDHVRQVQLPPEAATARSSRHRAPPWKEKVMRALKYRVRLAPIC